MPAFLVPLGIAALSAVGGLLSGRKSARTSTSSQSGTSSSTENYSTTPTYDETGQQIRKLLFDQLQERFTSSPDFIKSYINKGIKDINASSDITQRLLDNSISSRGLSRTSAGANPLLNLDLSRIMAGLNLKSSAPLLEEDLKQKRLQELMQFFQLQPIGRTGTSTRDNTFSQKGKQIGPGSMLGGAFSGGAQALGYFAGRGAFGGGGGNSVSGASPSFPTINPIPNFQLGRP